MIFKTNLLIGGMVIFICGLSYAQLRIPIFDVELNIQQNEIPGEGREDGDIGFAESTNVYAGVHVQINQHIALGGFYSRSFRGEGKIQNTNGGNSVYREVLHLQKGMDVRLSSRRAKKWRKYLVVSYSQVELVQVGEAFRLADKSNAFGSRLGIMRKLSNNLYLNMIDLGSTVITDDIFWFGSTSHIVIFDAKMGLTYNIGKKK